MSRNRRKQDEQQIDLTPMLDVVFIMLIFFIVTATFIKLPGQDVIKALGLNAENRKPSMLVAIDDKSAIWINGEKVEERLLKSKIAIIYSDNPKGEMVIQPDKDAEIGKLALVADAAKEVGVEVIYASADGGS